MLNQELTRKICDFIKLKPRSIQEIAEHINKNWRTAERYVEKIEEETGFVSTRIFRKGTRGALKIVFWNLADDIHSTSFQAELIDKIMSRWNKGDFTPFDIFQYVPDNKKKALVEYFDKIDPEIELSEKQNFVGLLRQASKQILFFSGNLSWVNSKQGKIRIIDVIRELARRNVSIKVVCRVSMVGLDNVRKLLAINKEFGKDLIEIRHRYQPLRAAIIDNKIMRFRESKNPEYYTHGELDKKIEMFYEIYDHDWIEWMQKIFWKMFSTGIPAETRIKEMEKIRKIF